MTANIAIKSELSAILPIIFSIFCRAKPNLHFLSVARKKTEAKERARKRPELRGRNTNSSNHSMNSLRSNSISYFVPQIAFRNPRLNIDSKNLHSSKDLFVRNVFEKLRDADNLLLIWRIYPIKARILEKKKIIPKTFRTFRAPW